MKDAAWSAKVCGCIAETRTPFRLSSKKEKVEVDGRGSGSGNGSHLSDGSQNVLDFFVFTTETVFPKNLKSMNSGSEGDLQHPNLSEAEL